MTTRDWGTFTRLIEEARALARERGEAVVVPTGELAGYGGLLCDQILFVTEQTVTVLGVPVSTARLRELARWTAEAGEGARRGADDT